MVNNIHHIGLHIVERDLYSFYVSVLECEIVREFSLAREEAFPIFNIMKSVQIVNVRCGSIEMELFIDNDIKMPSFNHICICNEAPTEIWNKAKAKGFRTHVRLKSNGTKTYFISDSNCNLFEIKEI